MKTADLIPFILLELNDCDKYGFELTKNIEAKSGGKIVIKQPTLYTLLKKLEKSKFISSYWQDSEIGGKRHYYKITQNGQLQVSTFPSYEILMKNILEEDFDEQTTSNPDVESSAVLDNINTPSETIIPTSEIFDNHNIDTQTDLELNLLNADILKDKTTAQEEQFASNEDVKKFTEKLQPIQSKTNVSINKNDEILSSSFVTPHNELDIKYVDYVDFKNCKENIYAKKVTTKKLLQILATSASILLLSALCELITMFTGHSALYYSFFIAGILTAIFYPAIYVVNMEKFRLKCQQTTYMPKLKHRLFIGLIIELIVLILTIVVSISLGKQSILQILNFKNFANFYAPILISSIYLLDLLYNRIIVLKINK